MRTGYLILLFLLLSMPASSFAAISSTFDDGINGWTVEGRNDADGTILTSTGGGASNPGGYLEVSDHKYDWLFAVAPDKFRTDWGSHTSISADIMGDIHPWHYTAAFFLLSGDNKWKHEFEIGQVLHREWATLSAPIEEASWSRVAGEDSWNNVVSDVTDFWIRVDLASFDENVSTEFNGIDNVALAPEPVSSTLFLIGAVTLGFRRFWKNRGTI